jgi:hypothetical protein
VRLHTNCASAPPNFCGENRTQRIWVRYFIVRVRCWEDNIGFVGPVGVFDCCQPFEQCFSFVYVSSGNER